MAIGADFEIQADKDIRHVSGTSTYTVLELHQWLQGLADDAAASGDDILDITIVNPSNRSTDTTIELVNGFNISDAELPYLYGGSIEQASGDTLYSGLAVYGTLASGNLEMIQNNALVTDTWTGNMNADTTAGIIMRTLVKTRASGSDIDGKRVRVQSRTFGYTYTESRTTLGEGEGVAFIETTTDLNNQTASGTVGGWTITNTEGYQGLDINGDGSDEYYYSQWDKGSQSINDVYEYGKYIMRDGTSETIHGISGSLFRGITHQFDYDNEASGPFQEDEILSWGTGATAGTGLLLALDDNGTTGTMWIQLLTGVIITNNTEVTGGTSSATADCNGTPTQRTIDKNNFMGISTGANIIGAFGIGFVPADVGASDTFTDLGGNAVTPPNNVAFTVSGLVDGDRVLVTSYDGSTVDDDGLPVADYGQFALNTTLNGGTETSLVITTTIPTDTPSSGTIFVTNDEGYNIPIAYSSYSGNTFTITSTNFSGSGVTDSATAGNDVFLGYIHAAESGGDGVISFTTVYSSDRNLAVFVRDGGATPIKPFATTGTLGSAGGSATAIRTSDS
jgi:hypothetical protein